uniref:NUDIX hydrolase n=1 Tax=Amycolatopsis sp. CA-290885 TaxID=3239925 RepID=UPI003F4912B8
MTTTHYRETDRRLLPDETMWGQGIEPYTGAQLDEIHENVRDTRQPGYGRRLLAEDEQYQPRTGRGRAFVPPGYDATGHPNRARCRADAVDPDVATAAARQPLQLHHGLREYFTARGWVLDQHGRPLHPHAEQLLGDHRIGMPTGAGFAWWYGETIVADAVVTVGGGQVLVLDRDTDTGIRPSIPGGYSIPQDFGRTTSQWRRGDRPVTTTGIIAAAVRRTSAETGLVVPVATTPRLIRGIRPVSSPHTVHAWTTTITVHIDLGGRELPALDRATTARWVPAEQLHEHVLPRMWPDHRRAVLAALR